MSFTSDIKGLSREDVLRARALYGVNQAAYRRESAVLSWLRGTLGEPMILMLLAASCVYFFRGAVADGVFMICAIFFVAALSLYQDARSQNAMEKLKVFTRPACFVIREGVRQMIPPEELVPGDVMIVEEGQMAVADGKIFRSHDFSVNESLLTGESLPVYKDPTGPDPFVYQGTAVTAGLALVTVTATGARTKLGLIGKSLEKIREEKSPLERQINGFVTKMVLAGALAFLLVWGINYFNSHVLAESFLKALTLAMSILPEEIPVAFATFMALGAWRLMKQGIIVRQIKTIETLGSATVICTDKTGTITRNEMSLAALYVAGAEGISLHGRFEGRKEKELIRSAMWASEPLPFDPMEVTLHRAYAKLFSEDERPSYRMTREYPLGGHPPMMTHVFEHAAGTRIIAAKGAPEALMAVCGMTPDEEQQVQAVLDIFAAKGYRVLGVGDATFEGATFPESQQSLPFHFKGLVAFYDPPKENINQVFRSFYDAGIAVRIITGDHAATTVAIARQVGFVGWEHCMNGQEVMAATEEELKERCKEISVFTRMFPEAKLRVIRTLRSMNEVVAMTGDGINDGPALKAAHIGIAMGRKGTEIAKAAASLILVDDDLGRMVDAIAMGRSIYANLKKAIRYIVSIHIPIILVALLPLLLGWQYPNIFSPAHVIFLELIMGPTCSIVYELEPAEQGLMNRPPRPFTQTFFNPSELGLSILQGLVISAAALGMYQYGITVNSGEAGVRTLVFVTILSANIFLTLVNRSFYHPVWTTIRYANRLLPFVIVAGIVISCLLIAVPSFRSFFGFRLMSPGLFGLAIASGCCSVIWIDLLKWLRRRRDEQKKRVMARVSLPMESEMPVGVININTRPDRGH